MSERGYRGGAAINWLNDDILLSIFNCYRLNNHTVWNKRLGWCKLTHVCQRWRHLIYEFTSHLGMHIQCTHGTPIAEILDHFPPLPLLVDYTTRNTMTERDELGAYHALRLHDRVREIYLHLPPSILHKCLVLMVGHFPILDRLDIVVDIFTTATLPSNAFLAPNLRHLVLFDVSRDGLESQQLLTRLLTSTVSLVTLKLRVTHTYFQFHPTLLVARLSSLARLEELSISIPIYIPRPSAKSELLGEERTFITLPNLKTFQFIGNATYLESLVSQVMAPHLEYLDIPLFYSFTCALPHLSHFINIAIGFEPHTARVHFHRHEVCILTTLPLSDGRFLLRIGSGRLDWQTDCATQICTALIPALCGVERLVLELDHRILPTDLLEISTTWHELLRQFIGIKTLYVYGGLLEELSGALQVDEIGSDPKFLPNLQRIFAADNLFTSFIDARRVVGRPVQFSLAAAAATACQCLTAFDRTIRQYINSNRLEW
jgi:hypothetical protein